jgi:MEDS: MEthanogen/methylotroph, DcmR Sensory domain
MKSVLGPGSSSRGGDAGTMIGMAEVATGIAGLSLASGDHVCAFYHGEGGEDEILAPFIRSAMDAGDKCICIIDRHAETRLGGLLTGPFELNGCVASGQLELLPPETSYLRGGSFTTRQMLEFWDAHVSGALASGHYGFVRALGDATWAVEDPQFAEQLFMYEAELNRFLPRYPQVFICLYDIDRCRGDILVDILKTHPKLVLASMIVENPYYLDPGEFLASRRR